MEVIISKQFIFLGNYTQESQLMRKNFEKRTGRTQELLRKVMERSDRFLWRCDPTNHVEGVTYLQLTRLMQGYVENEVDLNNDETCRENCAHYQLTESYGCFKGHCNDQPKCAGKLLYCQYIDSDMWICPSSPDSTRRYEYIEYENGKILGDRSTCTRGTSKVKIYYVLHNENFNKYFHISGEFMVALSLLALQLLLLCMR